MTPVTLSIIGAGHRGAETYGRYCLEHPGAGRVVAVAEPDAGRRERFGDAHAIPATRRFRDWRQLLAGGRISDAVVIATPDHVRAEPTLAAIELGYDVLLEKPVAPTEDEVVRIADAVRGSRGAVTIAHVLRYTPFFLRIKGVIDGGELGQLASIQYTENVGYWHFAHSYVRGNWRNAGVAGPFILAKACHDLDMIRWLADAPCRTVSSVGGLLHFHSENAPPGAPERCTDGCSAAPGCPFYAPRLYVERLAGHTGWPVSVITHEPSREGRLRALREGPYGRCVYRCDNDVADHQAVALEFANGVSATFSLVAFTADNTRTLKLMGSHGELRGRLDTGEIEVRRFLPDPRAPVNVVADGRACLPGELTTVTRVAPIGQTGLFSGHAGGDDGLMRSFIADVHSDDDRLGPTSLSASLESHAMAFAAERSRLERQMVEL